MGHRIMITLAVLSSFVVPATHNAAGCAAFADNAIVCAGNANPELAQRVADQLGLPLAPANVSRFHDGEVHINVHENVRNKDVYIVQSTCPAREQSINDYLMELYLLIRTMQRASAASITLVMPYYGYARQDRKVKPRVPISAADVAHMIEFAGADRVVTIDLHCGQIQGFFTHVPVDNLYGSLVFVPYLAHKSLHNTVVVSPDAGGVERADSFKQALNAHDIPSSIAMISKQRAQPGVVASMQLIGSVQDADAIIVDDLCDTGGTLVRAAEVLKDHGARRVMAAITHPVFSKDALAKIGHSCIDEMIITDTIPIHQELPDNVQVLSVADVLAEAMCRIQNGASVSALFDA